MSKHMLVLFFYLFLVMIGFGMTLSILTFYTERLAVEDGEVHIFIAETPQATEVTVENTGSQIPPKALPRLFDRFYRADAARAHPSSEGAGLGLSITKAIVEAHGGSVLVQSSQDKTQFSLKFPR